MNWLRSLRELWHRTHNEPEKFDRGESVRERAQFKWERIQLERRIQIVEAMLKARGGRASD